MAYLDSDEVTVRVGGDAVYIELTDDDGDGSPDDGVETFLLAQVDAVADAFARRGGYSVPLSDLDAATVQPFLLDIANYKAKTRGNRTASADDIKLYDAAMAVMEEIANGAFKLPSYQTTSPVEKLGFDSPQGSVFDSTGPLFSRDTLRGF
jgi:phage gp36-like protein